MIAITDAVTAYLFFLTLRCELAVAPEIGILLLVLIFLVMPVIYLALMFITLKSPP